MNNLYIKLLSIMMLCSFGAYSQTGTTTVPVKVLSRNHSPSNVKPTQRKFKEILTIPYSESDFSDPSDWLIGNDAGNNDDWVIGTDVPSGAYAIARYNVHHRRQWICPF